MGRRLSCRERCPDTTTQLLAAKNLLIVTAHPDDECLFFAPSILGVLDRNRGITGGLLAMSTGNAAPSLPPSPDYSPTTCMHLPFPDRARARDRAPKTDTDSSTQVLAVIDDTLGNNYGIGETRKSELIGSCKALGINVERCVAIDREELQDNPKALQEPISSLFLVSPIP